MNSVVLIRPAHSADLKDILALARTAQEAPNWTDDHYAGLLNVTVDRAPRRALLLAEKDREPVGFCVISVSVDEGEVENIIVSSSSRRLGVGKKLLREALVWSELNGAKQIWLEVRESNVGALALYKSLGFEATGCRRSYYRDPIEDAVIMRAATTGATRLQ